jgi:hypothetical protein
MLNRRGVGTSPVGSGRVSRDAAAALQCVGRVLSIVCDTASRKKGHEVMLQLVIISTHVSSIDAELFVE